MTEVSTKRAHIRSSIHIHLVSPQVNALVKKRKIWIFNLTVITSIYRYVCGLTWKNLPSYMCFRVHQVPSEMGSTPKWKEFTPLGYLPTWEAKPSTVTCKSKNIPRLAKVSALSVNSHDCQPGGILSAWLALQPPIEPDTVHEQQNVLLFVGSVNSPKLHFQMMWPYYFIIQKYPR